MFLSRGSRAASVLFVALICAVAIFYLSIREAEAGAADQTRVLQGIPAIARAFAPVGGVKWQDFANVLAGICAVESKCDPTYPHYVNGGKYSQYQGLFQMNMYEVSKAEAALGAMLPQMQAAAASDPEQQKAFDFVKKAIDAARSMSGDRRFHPEYGIILGAAKHIRTNAVLARQYPGDPLRQAAGHLTAQFSGITEGKILRGQFGAPITGTPTDARTEAGALAVNNVVGASTVANAIEVAAGRYASKMTPVMQRMSQVTSGLTAVPDAVRPFDAPAFQPGTSPILDQSYGGVSTLMESGMLKPTPAPAFTPTSPPQTSNIPPPSQSQSQLLNQLLQDQIPGAQDSSVNIPSAFLIIAQPKEVRRGDPMVVSWTSVGMSTASPCVVFMEKATGSAQIARENEGTRRITTDATTALGTWNFRLQCTSPTSTTKTEQTASIILK